MQEQQPCRLLLRISEAEWSKPTLRASSTKRRSLYIHESGDNIDTNTDAAGIPTVMQLAYAIAEAPCYSLLQWITRESLHISPLADVAYFRQHFER